VGETLAETRLAVEAHRADLQHQADELEARIRRALDLRARFRENPALFIGIGAGALFLVAGGPMRMARLVRRRLRPSAAEQAYDALPKSLQTWIDTVATGVGPRAAAARYALAEELLAWRHNATRSRKARKQLAKSITEGPPGPERAIWRAVETALGMVSAAVARKAVERFITGEPVVRPASPHTPDGGSTVGPGPREYSGFATAQRLQG
jgi:hypothetical protein